MKLFLITIILSVVSFSSFADSPYFCDREKISVKVYDMSYWAQDRYVPNRHGMYLQAEERILKEALGNKKDEAILEKMIEIINDTYKNVGKFSQDEKKREEVMDKLYSDSLVIRICGKK